MADIEEHLPKRKRNRLKGFDYSFCGAYFVTICVFERRNIFWNNVGATNGRPPEFTLSSYGKIADDAIKNISAIYHNLSVDHYIIMPNHIHLLITVKDGRPMVAPTISRVINQLKGHISKRIGFPVWQKSFYDHIIRNPEDYDRHVAYIDENPVRWQYDELYSDN